MPRLFTALDLPPAAIDAIRDFQQNNDLDVQARWTPPENLHITLRFVGEVGEEKAEAVEAALDEAPCPAPFDIEPLGLGVLPSRRTPRVLTARIDPTEPLRTLYQTLQDVLAEVSVEREKRTFRPHITLARFRDDSPERVYDALSDAPPLPLDPFSVDRFYLYESTLTPDGAVHTIRTEYPFDTG